MNALSALKGAEGEAPVIVVHSLAHAVAALNAAARAGRPVILASAREAGIYAGAGWFAALLAEARAAVPAARCGAILNCGDDPAAALVAIRAGVERVVFTGRADVAERLADIARQHDVRLETEQPPVAVDLDFLGSEPALGDRLASVIRICYKQAASFGGDLT